MTAFIAFTDYLDFIFVGLCLAFLLTGLVVGYVLGRNRERRRADEGPNLMA